MNHWTIKARVPPGRAGVTWLGALGGARASLARLGLLGRLQVVKERIDGGAEGGEAVGGLGVG